MDKPYKRLYRSKKGKVLMGLMAGLGEYFKIDPIILRIALVALMFLHQSGLIVPVLYFIVGLIIPFNPEEGKP
ncbi:MAG: PspC domain-containing protein [bacterium]|nr:PspC domain-containing protein [bacterium]